MEFSKLVTKVNDLLDSEGDYDYSDMVGFFNEAVDEMNNAIEYEMYSYFPDTIQTSDVYGQIPNRYQILFMCHFVAAKLLSADDEYEDQRKDYYMRGLQGLNSFVAYHFNTVEPLTIEKNPSIDVEVYEEE